MLVFSSPLPHIHESGVNVYLKRFVASFTKENPTYYHNNWVMSMSVLPLSLSVVLIIYSQSVSPPCHGSYFTENIQDQLLI